MSTCGLTVEGVDPSGDPLHDRIFHLPSPHALDPQILETEKMLISKTNEATPD